jgi:hypothetical protein
MAIIVVTFTACKKENEENLINQQGGPVACDTVDMKYTVDILPILVNRCYECHGNGLSQNGVNFDTYDNVKRKVDDNELINVIKHTAGYPAMPFGKPMLPSCEINKIQAWINEGAPNN